MDMSNYLEGVKLELITPKFLKKEREDFAKMRLEAELKHIAAQLVTFGSVVVYDDAAEFFRRQGFNLEQDAGDAWRVRL